MTCRCSTYSRATCAGGGITPPGEPCRCRCHDPLTPRTLATLRRQVARAARAVEGEVAIELRAGTAAPATAARVVASIGGRVEIHGLAGNTDDAAQLVSSAAYRALDFGAPREAREARARRDVARGLPVFDVPPRAELRAVECKTKVVGATAADMGEYAAAAAQDPAGRACKVWVEIGPDLTGDATEDLP